MGLAWQFASISSPADVSLNTSNQDHSEKMIRTTPFNVFNVLNDEFVVGHIGLVPAHLPRSLQHAHARSAVTVLSVDACLKINIL